jgi:hypothetical protein
LEVEAGRNLELIFLLGGLVPDFKTIADFRKNNRECFKSIFKQFNLLCRQLGLFGAELVAIDGSKFKAVNNPARRFTAEQFVELAQAIDKKIEEYLQKLDQQDTELEGVNVSREDKALQEKIAKLKDEKSKVEALVKELEGSQDKSPATDLDSRPQKRVGVGYIVQVALDAMNHLIVDASVVQDANDRGQLAARAVAAKQELGVQQLKVVADAGYHEGEQLNNCAKQGIETYVPAQGTTSGQSKNGQKIFPKENFVFDPEKNSYRCPAGQSLEHSHEKDDKGKTVIIYKNPKACQACPLKSQCTQSEYRSISRSLHQVEIEQVAKRVSAHKEIVTKRKTIVEHVFGSLRTWGHDTFLTRGMASVLAEFSLSALTYNWRRALQVVGVERLMAVMALRTS